MSRGQGIEECSALMHGSLADIGHCLYHFPLCEIPMQSLRGNRLLLSPVNGGDMCVTT
jgi:hypothetical protein